ncbi:DUF547 domain-containing protein [Seonamhaeicola algicola]|uniref:DUF547 domain-containing protein n=2 Tax=Seonamhaeicola TaxID=1649495 RepID=A0A5C7AC21_9FLAO|nr:DUF547 domain-containing protein [Seonamhaeicola algicola]TXE06186.1 DUF547 domain-containing protein [Seonamhaeicola algicola]
MARIIMLLFCVACISCKTKKQATTIKNTNNPIVKVAKQQDSVTKNIQNPTNQDTVVSKFNQVLSKKTYSAHQLWNELLQKHVSTNGNVDYIGFKEDQEDFYGYLYSLNLMYKHESFKTLTKEEKLAFWINAYNALTVDLILRNYPTTSIRNIKDPWKQRLWKFGNKWYNLDEIEHAILRKMDEPRIHFAINCASISCPKLQNKAFTSKNLETQLTNATKAFLLDTSKNIISKNAIQISKIFQWFSKDFKTNGSLIDFLNTYSTVQISANAKKSFLDYNWNLNE